MRWRQLLQLFVRSVCSCIWQDESHEISHIITTKREQQGNWEIRGDVLEIKDTIV
jgi:hypothetical protein